MSIELAAAAAAAAEAAASETWHPRDAIAVHRGFNNDLHSVSVIEQSLRSISSSKFWSVSRSDYAHIGTQLLLLSTDTETKKTNDSGFSMQPGPPTSILSSDPREAPLYTRENLT